MEYINTISNGQLDTGEYLNNNPLLFNFVTKTYVNLSQIKNEPKYRAYKDETTSSFVSTFFHDENILNYFIYFNYQTIHYMIMSQINQLLSENNEILKSNEDIFVIFKGGNIMHFYFNKIIEFLYENTSDEKTIEYLEPLNELNKYFKISDVDLTLYIVNNNVEKYNLLYFHISKILIKALEYIRDEFESLYNNNLNGKINSNVPKKLDILSSEFEYLNEDIIDLYEIHNLYKYYCLIFENFNYNLDLDLDLDLNNNVGINILISNFKKYFYLFKKDSKFGIFTDAYIGSRYILLLELIKYYFFSNSLNNKNITNITNILYSDNDIKNFIDKIDTIIGIQNATVQRLIKNKFCKLSDFYNKSLVNEFITKIINNFNGENFQNKYFYDTDSSPSVKYTIDTQLTDKNIYLQKRKDFIFRNQNSIYFNEMLEYNKENFHFISINNSISNKVGNDLISFDLYRIKFNVKFDQIHNLNANTYSQINIPSEFLDVSISKYFDDGLEKLRFSIYNNDKYIDYFSKLNNSKTGCKNILSTNLKYTIKDLNLVLYGNTFIPWNDLKYNKRIIRLLFNIFIYYFQKANEYDCVDPFNRVLDKFINNLSSFIIALVEWFKVPNDNLDLKNECKNKIFHELSKIIKYNDSSNNILNINTFVNFYTNDTYFHIKFYSDSDENANIFHNIMHDELNPSLNTILKIGFYIVSDFNLYKNKINEDLNKFNYIFYTNNDKEEYINKTFIIDYIKYLNEFLKNFKFIKNIIFNFAPRNSNIPTTDILIGGKYKNNNKIISIAKIFNDNYNIMNMLRFNQKYFKISSSKFTNIKFDNLHHKKNNPHYIDFENLDMKNV